MNERIRDLLPNPFAVDYQYKDGPLDLYTEKEMIRFAQIIVRECVKNLETNKRCDIYTGELIDSDWNDVIQHQIVSLIEHFGVEEWPQFQCCSLPR